MAPRRRRHHNHSRFRCPTLYIGAAIAAFLVTSGGRSNRDIWTLRMSKFYYGCSNASNKFSKAETITRPNRYLWIATSGGLNQQRTGITDAVVAARILNATLVVPKLDQKSFWKDASNFAEIFDVDWFISHLANDVKIIKELPRRGGKTWTPYTMRVPRKCNERCYQIRVLPVLLKKHAVQLTKFDYRLANKLETDLQKLRCRVNYHALRFTDPITKMGETLVHRMRMMSKHYIALHLRFEPDMLAFSGCYYGGGDKEIKELGKIRKRWKTLHTSNPDKVRRQGRCPLTPEEIGLMLRALGYGKEVHIYVASGEVYGGEDTLAPLKALFPNTHSKDTIASKKELEPFSAFSSRMAALDFLVCDESDVFVTNNNGNMAKILAGRRRYFGHKPTIRPNAKKLYRLFLNRDNMTWEEFASRGRRYQKGFMGEPKETRPGRGEFHENPSSCICEDSEAKLKMESGSRKLGRGKEGTKNDLGEAVDDQNNDNELELSDPEDEEDLSDPQGKGLVDGTSEDYDPNTSEEPELEVLLSD
ncbi:hypothetical protein RJ640_020736 [Escallonia rubra]|uniref:O-fucosyltransferase family protein n=1 Tax=Escallonia rubra TaxID=112253 RepID=A0AA88S9W7_9ASTE|nr:hypothetical protein RJ640_020736 [Escallonia rubra]